MELHGQVTTKRIRKAARRATMFQRGSRAWSMATGRPPGRYACPLCLVEFDESALHDGRLTDEDVPPRALGGKPLVLTCRRCNNTSGHSLDAALVEREELRQFLGAVAGRGQYSGRVSMKMLDQRVKVDLTVDDDVRSLRILPDRNPPTVLSDFSDAVRQTTATSGWDGLELTITSRHSFRERYPAIAELRIAYLLAFSAFGYRYACQPFLDPARRQIDNPDEEILPAFAIPLPPEGRGKRIMLAARKPVPCLVVILDHTAIVLPWIGAADPAAELQARYRQGEPIRFTGAERPWPSRLEFALDFARTGDDLNVHLPQIPRS